MDAVPANPMRPEETRPALPPCSLIICSRNRPRLLIELVQSVLAGQERPREIIIVDQSNEALRDLPGEAGDGQTEIRYQLTRTVGASRARNLGIHLARHDLLAFSDDDMLCSPEWFGSLVRALVRSGERGVVSGSVRSSGENPQGFAPSTQDDSRPMVFEGRVGRDVLYTGNMAMYRATVDAVGLFDERLGPGTAFPAAEDNDFGFRLLEAGYRIVFVPEALLYHRDWRSDHRDFLPLRWKYGLGQGGFLAKHCRLSDRYMTGRLFRNARHYFSRCLRGLRRDRHQALGDATYLLGLFTGLVRWRLTQREIGPPDAPRT